MIESEALCLKVARSLRNTCEKLGITYVFKASFDKANRTSGKTKRGPGIEAGLEVLAKVRDNVGVPVLTDVHNEAQAEAAVQVVDAIQIPAFLCRQTDLIEAAARTGALARHYPTPQNRAARDKAPRGSLPRSHQSKMRISPAILGSSDPSRRASHHRYSAR